MDKAVQISPRLHFMIVKAQTGEIDSYLQDTHAIEFQQGDVILAQAEVSLTDAERESIGLAIVESDERLSSENLLASISAKIFLAGFNAKKS